MAVLLTGATGFIGRAVMERLLSAGYGVTALVADQDEATEVRAAGAEPFFAEEDDTRTVSALAVESDGVIHTATSREYDADFIDGVLPGLVTGDKPFIYTGSLWVYGSGAEITESTPLSPPDAVSWIAETQQRLMVEEAVRVVIVAPGIVYGHGQGLPRRFVDDVVPIGAQSVLPLIGEGTQRWATVHVDDLADLYLRILQAGAETNKISSHTNEVYIAAGDAMSTVAELASAAATASGATVAPETPEATRQRLGAHLAEVLLLDQHARADKARDELGWRTTRPALVDELRAGYLDVPGDPLWG